MNVDQHTYFFDVDGDNEPSIWRLNPDRPTEAVQVLRRHENAEVFELLERLLSPPNAAALREVKAQALREAADEMEGDPAEFWDVWKYTGTDAPKGWSDNSVQGFIEAAMMWAPWLRGRAERIVGEAGDDV